jgi:hypothetical protein
VISIKGDELCLQDILCAVGIHAGSWDPEVKDDKTYTWRTMENKSVCTRIHKYQEFQCGHCGARKVRTVTVFKA